MSFFEGDRGELTTNPCSMSVVTCYDQCYALQRKKTLLGIPNYVSDHVDQRMALLLLLLPSPVTARAETTIGVRSSKRGVGLNCGTTIRLAT